jgi:hypothetical protein
MKCLVRLSLVVVLGCVPAAVAVAQPPMESSPAEMVKRADADGDGKVSRDEFIKARTIALEQAFTRMDTDGDGKLDEKEVEAGAAQARAMGPAGLGGFRRPDADRPQRPGADRPQRPGAGAMAEQGFDRMDADGDGKLSKDEFAAGMKRLRELMERAGPGIGGPRRPGGGERGPEQGFRRPPQQD